MLPILCIYLYVASSKQLHWDTYEALENEHIMRDGLRVAVNGMKLDGVPYPVERILSLTGLRLRWTTKVYSIFVVNIELQLIDGNS